MAIIDPFTLWLVIILFILSTFIYLYLKRKGMRLLAILLIALIISLAVIYLWHLGYSKHGTLRGVKYLHYTIDTIKPELGVNKEMMFKVEFELSKNFRDVVLTLNLPEEFQVYVPEEKMFLPAYWVGVRRLGNLSKNKIYEYHFRIKATKPGYWRMNCALFGKTLLSAGGKTGRAKYIEITPEGGRVEDYDFREKNLK